MDVERSPEEAVRRPHHILLFLVVGALIGFAVGAAIVLLVDRERLTGDDGSVFTFIFGLPALLSIPGGVAGVLFSVAKNAPATRDAPVRQRRFAARGRAAASVEGQLPGSPVPPRYVPEPDGDERRAE